MKKEYNNGITLVSLIITFIVFLIIISIGLYANTLSIKNVEKEKYIENINQIETAINTRWLRYQNDNSIGLPGTKLDSVPTHLSSIIAITSNTSDEDCYYYIDNNAINLLNLKNIEENKYIVCYSTGEVISVDGIENNGKYYYTKSLTD